MSNHPPPTRNNDDMLEATNALPEKEDDDGKVGALGRLVHSRLFNNLTIVAVLVAGALVGVDSYLDDGELSPLRHAVDLAQDVILWYFVAEAAIRIGAFGSKPWRYFLSAWNVFDFIIIAACFMSADNEFAAVLRLARILRTLRLVTTQPRLQVLVTALLKSIPSLVWVGMLLAMHFYVYAIMGTYLFGQNDPIRFGTLHETMLTLFQVLTLEGWNDVLGTQYLGSDFHGYDDSWKAVAGSARVSVAQPIVAAGYFVSFIMLGTMIMLNLFTGVIIGSMEEARDASNEERERLAASKQKPVALQKELAELSEKLAHLSQVAANLPAGGSGGARAK